jgi:hypothetical protein
MHVDDCPSCGWQKQPDAATYAAEQILTLKNQQRPTIVTAPPKPASLSVM